MNSNIHDKNISKIFFQIKNFKDKKESFNSNIKDVIKFILKVKNRLKIENHCFEINWLLLRSFKYKWAKQNKKIF